MYFIKYDCICCCFHANRCCLLPLVCNRSLSDSFTQSWGGIHIAGKTPSDITYEQHFSNMQKKINDTIAKNKELHEIKPSCKYIYTSSVFQSFYILFYLIHLFLFQKHS